MTNISHLFPFQYRQCYDYIKSNNTGGNIQQLCVDIFTILRSNDNGKNITLTFYIMLIYETQTN